MAIFYSRCLTARQLAKDKPQRQVLLVSQVKLCGSKIRENARNEIPQPWFSFTRITVSELLILRVHTHTHTLWQQRGKVVRTLRLQQGDLNL